jgi:hypothetical protein
MAQLIGTAPSQVPTNGDLGSAAYMDSSAFYGTGLNPVFRNRIMNGAMLIDQRRSGAALTNVTGGADNWLVDRFRIGGTAMSSARFTFQQVSDAPSGSGLFKSGKVTVTATQTPNPSDIEVLSTFIETHNMTDFEWGKVGAKPAVCSFWVKASVPGLYPVAFRSDAAANATYIGTYTVNTSNTWEYKTISIPGPTAGTWFEPTTANLAGLRLDFDLGTGNTATLSDSLANTWVHNADYFRTTSCVRLMQFSGATWQITGLQLERGTVATPFEHRPIGVELHMCKRYLEVWQYESGATTDRYHSGAGWSDQAIFKMEVEKRSRPSVTVTGSAELRDGANVQKTITASNSNRFAIQLGVVPATLTNSVATIRFASGFGDAIIISAEY